MEPVQVSSVAAAEVDLNDPAPAKIRLCVGPDLQGSMSRGALPPFHQLALLAGSNATAATLSWSTRYASPTTMPPNAGEGPVHASNGLPFTALPLTEALAGAEILFVCGGLRIKPRNERLYLAALRRVAHQGIALGSLFTGAYLLARAGLLGGYRCTIHWENGLSVICVQKVPLRKAF